jgi:hypothetical protein
MVWSGATVVVVELEVVVGSAVVVVELEVVVGSVVVVVELEVVVGATVVVVDLGGLGGLGGLGLAPAEGRTNPTATAMATSAKTMTRRRMPAPSLGCSVTPLTSASTAEGPVGAFPVASEV